MDTNKKNTTQKSTKSESKEKKDGQAKSTNKDIKQETTEQEKNEKVEEEEKGFWEDAKENISEGAKYVGETVSEYSEKIYHSVKETASEAYKYGSEFTLEAVKKAQQVIEEQIDKYEVRKLSDKRDIWTSKLGLHLYHTIKENDGKVPVGYIKEKKVNDILKEIEEIDQKILELKQHNTEK